MKKIIYAHNLTYQVPNSSVILDNINFDIIEGEFVGILGHNGSGKTTLIDLCMGYRAITSGTLEILGENPHSDNRKLKNKVAFLSHDVSLKGNLKLSAFLDFHSSFYDSYSKDEESRLLKVFGLTREMKIGSLSVGQQKKIQAIACLSTLPSLILLDEITAVMDPETRTIFFKELEYFRSKYNSTIVLATNIAEDLVERVERVIFISDHKASIHDPKDIEKLFNIDKVSA